MECFFADEFIQIGKNLSIWIDVYSIWIRGALLSRLSSLSTHGLTLIPTWISNFIHYKGWDEIIYPFPHFTEHVIIYPSWDDSLTMLVKGIMCGKPVTSTIFLLRQTQNFVLNIFLLTVSGMWGNLKLWSEVVVDIFWSQWIVYEHRKVLLN